MKSSFECRHLLPDSPLICFVVPGAFTATECQALLADFAHEGFQTARTHYPTYYRNNDRLVVDNPALAARLFAAIEPVLPKVLPSDTDSLAPWHLRELNSRLRFCGYTAGQYFHRHLDGVHFRSATVQSRLTFMIYLNDATDFEGGRTLFYRSKDDPAIWAEYQPAQGDLIVFDHTLWHEGEQLEAGEKFVLRSDILYETEAVASPTSGAFAAGHLGYIWQVLPFGGAHLVSGGRDKVLKIWNLEGDCVQQLVGHQNSVLCLAQLNSITLLSGSRDATIRVWEQQAGQFSQIGVLRPHAATVLCLARLSDESFVSGGADGLICVSTATGKLLNTLRGHSDWVWAVLPLAGGRLISSSEDGTLRIWNVADAQESTILCIGLAPAHVLLFDARSRSLISGHFDGTIQVRQVSPDLQHCNLLRTVPAHTGIVRTLVLLDDHRLASGGEDNFVRIWNLDTFQEQHQHQDFVQSVALLPERQELISASYDGKLKCWPI
ncbi:2OG-Fe(II) oxygenase [Hymenobacter puniceus]|uniref:2OG-Fe(II) oxygenase n=1 Tax=Hymenobacter sp. BT190 TaxID=2763505 RepID=UPI0016510D4B|nr:2OG-Fe(II) oxygenase [Hymenobacter sp. BT190]MBC6698237.1 2OG-Fe(II) oxygenase [Hymenobacter sp. BT190]